MQADYVFGPIVFNLPDGWEAEEREEGTYYTPSLADREMAGDEIYSMKSFPAPGISSLLEPGVPDGLLVMFQGMFKATKPMCDPEMILGGTADGVLVSLIGQVEEDVLMQVNAFSAVFSETLYCLVGIGDPAAIQAREPECKQILRSFRLQS